MNKDNVQYCFNRCPNCRQPMDEDSGIGLEAAVEMVDDAAASAAANAKQVQERMRQRAAQEAEEAIEKEALRAKALGNDEVLSTRLQDLTKQKLAGMFDYIAEVLHAIFDFKPNARVLLAFCMFGNNTDAAHRSVEKQLRDRCDRFETIGFCKDHGRTQIATYTDKTQTARILAINTNNGSKSLEGINLGDTDLVIFDRTGGGDRLNGVLTQGNYTCCKPAPCRLRPTHRCVVSRFADVCCCLGGQVLAVQCGRKRFQAITSGDRPSRVSQTRRWST